MSVSYIPQSTKLILWGIASGRCQFRGCNKPLYQDIITKSKFNQAYIAHIIADSPNGPRGDKVLSEKLKDNLTNLMLLCDEHHRLIDKVDVDGHPETLLVEMKKEHEERIARITSIDPNMSSHIVLYKANVGKHSPVLSYEAVKEYLLPSHYPATSSATDLSLSNSPQQDKNQLFWDTEIENLNAQFSEQLRPKFRRGEIKHLSLFAFAPQPLLIKLGTLLSDIHQIAVHQPVREPKSWNFPKDVAPIEYYINQPEVKHPSVALNISLSATINNDRITSVLGKNCSIYTLTIDQPFNDFLRSKRHLQDFSEAIRRLFNEIKAHYDSKTPLHIFPAMPIATAVELGRIWMPKADIPLHIYDENTANSGFFKALEIINH
ncbi:SAVED domain-containing protein [Tunicatimonas pelagia]|uniref:SAVED domain-containing protein n=1 Tax=Tunicatimonas pelagia TaxID=931531 RepID=UPI0026659528|nr:SAVED domain-containing protein [Tunicatimonas pelagia]WKN42907.1 SAVED domain-containing protein [Tunicatimonas pelagia]